MRKAKGIALGVAALLWVGMGGMTGCAAGRVSPGKLETPADAAAVEKAVATETTGIKTMPAPSKVAGYDFGRGAVWPEFVAVPGADNVAISAGAEYGEGKEGDFPDPLLGDYVGAERMTVTISGLSRDGFRGVLIAQNVVRGMVPGKDFSVKANGKTVVAEKVTPEWFFSEKGFFYGYGFEDLPGVDWWDRYVAPVAPWREFEFESDGKLVLELENCRLFALVVAPAADVSKEELETFVKATQASRKAHFLFNKLEFEPEKPGRAFRPTAREKERGYVVFSRGWGKHVTYNTVPQRGEVAEKLETAGTPGERVPVTFAVRTIRGIDGIRVSVSDLRSESGARIRGSAVDVRAVRYMMKPRGEKYVVVPETIQDQESLDLPAGTSKRWWLTVRVPRGTKEGVYRGKISIRPGNASGSDIGLSLRVYPFELAGPECSIGVWYDDPWIRGYCTGLAGGVEAQGDFHVVYDTPEKPTSRDRKVEAYRVRMLEADLRSLSEHGFTSVTVMVPKVVGVTREGKVELDFGIVEPYRELLRKYSINTAFAGQTYLLTTARQIAATGVDGKPVEEYSQLHQAAFKDATRQIRDWWSEGGVKLLAYAVDEPREERINPWNRDLEGTLYYLRLIEEVGGWESTVTTMRDVQNGVSYRPILQAEDVVQPHPSPHNKRSVAYARESGKPLWYFNGGGFRRYDFGFYIWSQKPQGYWQWHFDFRGMSFNPFWDEHTGYVVYPSPEGPVPTVRYERASQGIYDYRYALTLEDYIVRGRRSGKPAAKEAARKARRVLNLIAKSCRRWVLDGEWKPVEVRDEELSKWRSGIAGQIMAIKEALEGESAPGQPGGKR